MIAKLTKRVRMLLVFGLHFVLCITITVMQTGLKTTRPIFVCTILCAMALGTNSAWHSALSGAVSPDARRATDGDSPWAAGTTSNSPGGAEAPPTALAPGAELLGAPQAQRPRPRRPRVAAARAAQSGSAAPGPRRGAAPLSLRYSAEKANAGDEDDNGGGPTRPARFSWSGPASKARPAPLKSGRHRPCAEPRPRTPRAPPRLRTDARGLLLPPAAALAGNSRHVRPSFVEDWPHESVHLMNATMRKVTRSCQTGLWLPDQINFSSIRFTYLHITFSEH